MNAPHGCVPGQLQLRGLRCTGRHGAYPGELEVERTFLVDAALRVDLGEAAERDDLASTIDFAEVAEVARATVGGRSHLLLESLAVAIARALLDRFPACAGACVRVAKLHPPGLDADQEAVEVTLER